MALLFKDSFDHYNDLTLKWTAGSGGNSHIDLTNHLARTGIGCCVIDQATGPIFNCPQKATLIYQGGFYAQALQGDIMAFRDAAATSDQVRLQVQADGSVRVLSGNDPFPLVLFTSNPAVIPQGVWMQIQLKATFSPVAGAVVLYVNNSLICNLVGVNTAFNTNHSFATQLALRGAGGLGGDRHDDVLLYDTTGASDNDIDVGIAPIIVAYLPDADEAPLQWTPSIAGPHFSLVNSVPQQVVTNVNSGTVGQVDQYHYPVPPALLATILNVQHSMLANINMIGARQLSSNVNGVVGPVTDPLSTTPHYMIQPYDRLNPATGLPWVPADFITTFLGPDVSV